MIGQEGKDKEGKELNCVMCGVIFPTDRALRVHRRSCDASVEERRSQEFEQVHQEKANIEEVKNSGEEIKMQVCDNIKDHKTLRDVGPEVYQHHSAKQSASASHDPRSYQTHSNKSPLPQDFKYDRKPTLNLPKPNDPLWDELDKELNEALDVVLPKQFIKNKPPEKSIEKLNKFVYDFIQDKIPPLEQKPRNDQRNGVRGRFLDQQNNIRKQKADNRRAWRLLQKAGLQNTVEMKLLNKQRRHLLRTHNRLRTKIEKSKSRNAERKFRQNPMEYAKQLFPKNSKKGKPTFSKETAQEYFTKTYSDESRSHQFDPPEGLVRPEPPGIPFATEGPTAVKLEREVKKKKNGAKPGPNGLNYLIYKKLPSVRYRLLLICQRVHELGNVPFQWAMAYMILLAKYDEVDSPDLFRNIALTDCDGKLYFSMISRDLEDFMVRNGMIKTDIQKGFLTGIAGCVEHTFAFNEAFRDAYENTRQFISIWIDLENAYGSVMHNLIQFALWWYHVPPHIASIISDYYDKLCAQVVTGDWETAYFRYLVGLFQGCVLSTILFDMVFNLCLDLLAQYDAWGYTFKGSEIQTLRKAYADDLTLLPKNVEKAQIILDELDRWLEWTKSMKAKPPKCRCLALKEFKSDEQKKLWKPFNDHRYSPFDPKLTIKGRPVQAIGDPEAGEKEQFFKFLGRKTFHNRKDSPVKIQLIEDFKKNMETLDEDLVNGLQKAWICEHFLSRQLIWPMTVYDFPLSFAQDLVVVTNHYFKKWTKVCRSADTNIFYRRREHFGLQWTNLAVQHKKCQLIKCHLIKHSSDAVLRETYQIRENRFSKKSDIWRPTQELNHIEDQVNFEVKFKTGPDQAYVKHQGLGSGKSTRKVHLSKREHRQQVSAVVSRRQEEEMRAHTVSLGMQGKWTEWDGCSPVILSWKTLINTRAPKFIAFVLNCFTTTVATPELKQLWGYWSFGSCPLCGKPKCSLSHILSGCPVAREQGRFTWRHDSVLNICQPVLENHLTKCNEMEYRGKPITQAFVKADSTPQKVKRVEETTSLLHGAKDWKLLIDYDHKKIVFPPTICPTSQRPDIIIWSERSKVVIWAELTCPAEENIRSAQTRKNRRYADLADQVRNAGWTLHDFTVEAGARGCVADTFRRFLKKIGLHSRVSRELQKNVAFATARCSYAIYLAASNKFWPKHALLGGANAKPPSQI